MLEYKWFDGGVIDDSFRNLRIEIFVKEQGVPEENEFDSFDLEVPHLTIFSDGEAVATGRFIPYGENTVKIGRINWRLWLKRPLMRWALRGISVWS